MKFGVREIVDVVFKATANGQRIGDKTFKKYQPVFKIDTAQTSSLEQSTTTVYAQGGKGYARLIAWEGEKTMTFTVTDALMSPMGLAVLTGAGLINPSKGKQTHFHLALNGIVEDDAGTVKIDFEDIREELGLGDMKTIDICNTIDIFGTKLDGSGAGIDWYNTGAVKGAEGDYTTIGEGESVSFAISNVDGTTTTFPAKGSTVQVDFYVLMNNSITEVHIEPGSFGGYFYVEASTLYRREDTGKDMAAELIIPKAKIQSAFTFTMAASGDPSTFDFVMDAMPGYTRFDATTKKMCVIQIVGTDEGADETSAHTHEEQDPYDSPAFADDEFRTNAAVVPADAAEAVYAGSGANQAKATIKKSVVDGKDVIVATIAGGKESLANITPVTGWPSDGWVAVDYNTGEDSIVGLEYINRGTTTVLTEDDVAESAAVGLGAGHLMVWVRNHGTLPSEFKLQKKDADGNVIKSVEASIDMVDGE